MSHSFQTTRGEGFSVGLIEERVDATDETRAELMTSINHNIVWTNAIVKTWCNRRVVWLSCTYWGACGCFNGCIVRTTIVVSSTIDGFNKTIIY
jgi:hypothetical protein